MMAKLSSSEYMTLEEYEKLLGHRHEYLKDVKVSEEIEGCLNILSQISESLGLDEPTYTSFLSAITRRSEEELELKRSLLKLRHAEGQLTDHLAIIKHEEALINQWNEVLHEKLDSGENLVTLERRKSALAAKAREYQKDLEAINKNMPDSPEMTISDLLAFKERLKNKEQELKMKRAKIKTFQGLPPDLELARLELQKAQDEQMKLIQLRERLLGRMASSVI
ncbi:hypothetical protein C8Q75DRAFT_737957 [Abortiporus biennis]|nr:hypothetical protein C8Q75DRAFT_737957 [Abortiporus biennis]